MIDKEIWKDVPEFEGLYQVSNFGKIKSFHYKEVRILKPRDNGHGYFYVSLDKNHTSRVFYIHRLVGMMFVPISKELLDKGYTFDTLEINHKDEDKGNNHYSNLEWCTRQYNSNYGTGRIRASEKESFPVTCFDRKGDIIKLYPSMREAERQTGCPQSTIWKCVNGYQTCTKDFIWRLTIPEHTSDYKIPEEELPIYWHQKFAKSVTEFDREGNFIKTWPSIAEAARQLNISTAQISNILSGKVLSALNHLWKETKPEYEPGYKLPPEEIPTNIHYELQQKPVSCFDLDGFFIRSFKSIKEAADYFNISAGRLSSALRCKYNICKGHYWKYKNNEHIQGYNLFRIDDIDMNRPIIQFSIHGATKLNTFPNVIEAYKNIGIVKPSVNGWQRIIYCCKDLALNAYGFKWKFA